MITLFSDPQPFDILVSLIIGIVAGGLITALIFIFVIKKKWERNWEYYTRIKSISQIRLPQIAVDDATLSKNSLQTTVICTSSISDKGFLERVLSDDQAESDPIESLFLTPSVSDQIPPSQHTTPPASLKFNVPREPVKNVSERKHVKNVTERKYEKPSLSAPLESQGSLVKPSNFTFFNLSGSTLGKSDSSELDLEKKSVDDDDIPLGMRLNTFR